MKGRPSFFAFYPADFANDIHVEAMSTLQVGAYMLLLCKAWQADPPASLPNDDQILARFARVDAAVWQEIKAGVLVPFRLGTDRRLHSKRLRQEYDAALKRMRVARENGQKGGRPKRAPAEGDAGGAKPSGLAAGNPGVNQPGKPTQSSESPISFGDWRFTSPSEKCGPGDPAAGEPEKPDKKPKPKRGGKPTNPNLTPAIHAFCAAWGARHGAKYAFSPGKDAKHIADVLGHIGNNLDAFRALIGRYLADTDPFVTKNAHDLGTLVLKLNRWLVPAAAGDGPRGIVELGRAPPAPQPRKEQT